MYIRFGGFKLGANVSTFLYINEYCVMTQKNVVNMYESTDGENAVTHIMKVK